MHPALKQAVEAISEHRGQINLADDALVYAGAAVWDRWENHVPLVVQQAWGELDENARAAVFLTAEAVTHYSNMVK